MTPEEKATTVPLLRNEGNELYVAGRWFDAAAKYEEALNLLEQLCLGEKPGDKEFVEFDQSRIPFYINLAQCQYKLKVQLHGWALIFLFIFISTINCLSS